MYLSSKDLLDSAIGRRTFIQRMTVAGVSLVGAQAMAQSLVGSGDAASAPEASKILTDLTRTTAVWNYCPKSSTENAVSESEPRMTISCNATVSGKTWSM